MDAKSAHQQQYKVHKSPKHVKTHPPNLSIATNTMQPNQAGKKNYK